MKNFKKENCKHVSNYKCEYCKETEEILYDEQHGEIFCAVCGLILNIL